MPKRSSLDRLTKLQRRKVQELDNISSLFGLDYQNIQGYERLARTPHLDRIRRHFVIGEVVMQYTLIDEYLNLRLCQYFFGKRSSIRLWKTKKFQNFNYNVLEQLSLMEKLRFVRAIMKVPKGIVADIERINALRNGLAHAFFPENLKNLKPRYKGKDIFSFDGVQLFVEDMAVMSEFFLKVRLDGEQPTPGSG